MPLDPSRLACLDLFSGIGGFALGFDRAGIRTTAFCEINPYAREVLRKHWPATPVFEDVRTLNAGRLLERGLALPDIICGGFPCQDISDAGRRKGIGGERSGLWREFHRLVAEIRPAFVVAENVAALRSRGLDEVLGSLAEIGYDAEWHCVPASALGAPHRRDRIWIVAYPVRPGPHAGAQSGLHRGEAGAGPWDGESERFRGAFPSGPLADAMRVGLEGSESVVASDMRRQLANPREASGGWWTVESGIRRVADGVSARVDRLRCLGNAVVPQIPEMIARAIIAGFDPEALRRSPDKELREDAQGSATPHEPAPVSPAPRTPTA